MNAICFLLDNGNFRRFRMINLPEGILKSKIMEVKIKNGEEMIDATIEMVDGVMVVSPKKFEPKEGDVITCTRSNCTYTFILKYLRGDIAYSYAVLLDNGILRDNDWSKYENPHPATEEEKKLLFDKLKEEGYEWDAKKKEIIKVKWKPKAGETYWVVQFQDEAVFKFDIFSGIYTPFFNCGLDLDKIPCFKTEEECQDFCNRLNDAINQVKL